MGDGEGVIERGIVDGPSPTRMGMAYETDGEVEIVEDDCKGLCEVLRDTVLQIIYPSEKSCSIVERTKRSFAENGPLVKDATKRTFDDVLQWSRKGGAWRSFLVITVGTILLFATAGIGAFMLFFVVATTNAVVVSLLMSLAAVGGFLAIFFACLTAVYVGALSVAAFVISVSTFITISAVAVAAGWIGFFWLIWQAIKKTAETTKRSLTFTASALQSISSHGHGFKNEKKRNEYQQVMC